MPSAKQIINEAIKENEKTILSFPSNLGHHQMIIKFYEYEYARVSSGEPKQGVKASIALPLPQNIVDSSRLVAGTDCGFGTFAGFGTVDPDIAFAKLTALYEGTQIVNEKLNLQD